MKLSLLTILLGAVMCVPQIYGLARPKDFAATARKFPRNYAAGVVLTRRIRRNAQQRSVD